ncbi:hypothetical protein FGIG_11111 [Fasciola gigantica]|uniref:Coiled-coil alpha-helical rod protein 1 n=1 Tax=Fasciola gigantica TaxID=46835 RepID=A0A504YWN1_FASGI|nr:hypothetical protein FGIG_11111 [Fasciola gigantica]
MEDFGDFLLPPSAFHVTQAVSPSVQHSSTEMSGAKSINALTHDRMTVSNVQTGSVEEVDLPSSHQVASLLSRLTVAEAQLHGVEEKLLATHEEKVHLQRLYDEAKLQLQHLRTYYHGRVEQEVEKEMPIKSDKAIEKSRSTTTLDSRINELTNQIDILQKENFQVKSELELSILRSNSLEAALKLQDKQFSQASGGLMEQERTDKVFCYWRDHVLRLLVQLEQSKIEQEHSNGRMDRERIKMEKRFSDAQLELEATRHKLQASEAALTAVKGRAELLDSERHNQSTRLQTLEADIFRERHNMLCSLQSIKTNLATLSERVDNFAHAPTEGGPSTHGDTSTSVSELVRRMRHLERRLSFANNRLPLLRAQFILRSVVFSDRCDNWTQTENYSSGRTPSAMSNLELEELLTHTQNELRQCIAERDCALKKLEQNAKSFRERVRAAEDEVHTEVVGLRDLIVILEKDIKDKQEELNKCQIQLDSVKSDHVKLQQDTANEQVQLHTQLSDAQKQLNKAMIELRRTERRVEREADERRTRITEMEKSYKSRIETLEQALRSFQPDSYKWQTARLEQDNAIKIDTNSTQNSGGCVTSAQLEVLTASVSQLTRLADCLKSSNESSDTENDQPEEEFQTTDKI